MYMSCAQNLGAATSMERIRVPVRRSHATGRFVGQTVAWRHRHGLGDARPIVAPASFFNRQMMPTQPHLSGLGQYAEILAAAASYYAQKENDDGSDSGSGSSASSSKSSANTGGTSASGAPATAPAQPATTTAVSPAIQTQVSPQISPNFFQAQNSPGATQAATSTQYMPGGQGASTGGATAPQPAPTLPQTNYVPLQQPMPQYAYNYSTPGGFPGSPLNPPGLTDISQFPTAGSDLQKIQQSAPFDWAPIIWIAGIGGVSLIALTFLRKKRG